MQDKHNKWKMCDDYAIRSSFKRCRKKHPREYESCFENLDRVLEYLDNGFKWLSFQFNYLRSEGGDVFRIGQTGVPHAQETRLYIYCVETETTIYLLNMGDKDSQQEDIKNAKGLVERIERERVAEGATDENKSQESGQTGG